VSASSAYRHHTSAKRRTAPHGLTPMQVADLVAAVGRHLARLTGEEAERIAWVIGYLFAISNRRPRAEAVPSDQHPTVWRDGKYRTATAVRLLRKAG